jgi:CubicO group peptidase (beta-lactamase class C family)
MAASRGSGSVAGRRQEALFMRRSRVLQTVLLGLWCATALVLAQAPPKAQAPAAALPSAAPEAVGFSGARLQRLEDAMRGAIDAKELAGVVTAVARHGKVVHFKAQGLQDVASHAPMRTDTIFRIYSMTKPITGVAMMMLYEEGKWSPSDPLAKFIPAFASLKVFAGVDKDGKPVLEEPAHAPTVGELMTHTAGFTYGVFGDTAVDKLYQKENPLRSGSLQEFVDKLARLPLAYQPGEAWVYSVSVDVQGYLVEKLSGKTLPDFLRERIFDPLGMSDTGFAVPEGKLGRLATIYAADPKTGELQPRPRDPNISRVPGMASGGGGLYSTAGDYLRFAQMLLNGGALGSARLLAPSSVELMRSNKLPERLMTGKFGIGLQQMRPGFGFGYDVAVFDDPLKAGTTAGRGSYLWDGAAGTWFLVDPANDIVFVGMIQRMLAPGMRDYEQLSRALTYQALVDPKK